LARITDIITLQAFAKRFLGKPYLLIKSPYEITGEMTNGRAGPGR
jgi:hypothetical protein